MDKQTVIALSLPVLKKYHIKRAGLFGSIARGTATATSDVDLLIDPPDQFSLFDLAGLKIDLEDILQRSVDVVEYGSIKPILKESILRHEHPIF